MFDASSGAFVFSGSPNPEGPALIASELSHLLENTSVRVQVRMPPDSLGVSGNNIGISVRADAVTNRSYLAGILPNGELQIARNEPLSLNFTNLGTASTGLDPTQEDVLLQFDAIGNELSVRAWRPGEVMPSQPQIAVADSSYASGTVFLFFSPGGPNSDAGSGVFRFAHVADASIPEPSGLVIGTLVIGVLLTLNRRRIW